MLGKEKKQGDFFNDYVYSELLPEEDTLLSIAQLVDFGFVEEEVADLYSEDRGRPSYPPAVLFKMLFLEHYANLSDVEVSKQCRYNLLYRAFVGLGVSDPTPDDTTLVVFRVRLGEERFERLFERVVVKAQEAGLLKERLKIVDATHLIADVAIPNTVNLLRQGRKRVLKRLDRVNRKATRELEERYLKERKVYGKPSQEDLADEVELTQAFLGEVKGRYGRKVDEEVEVIEKILDPQEEGKVRSVVDPEARYGMKRKNQPFLGYKVHASQDESGLVTSLDVLPGNENEGSPRHLRSLVEKDEERGVHHQGLAADALYDSAENRLLAKRYEMEAYIPNRTHERQGDQFVYDPERDEVKCGQGKSSIGKIRQEGGELYYFSVSDCQSCPVRTGCVKQNEGRARVYLSDDYKLRMRVDPERKREALKVRKAIERKFGEAKKWHGLVRARYRTRARVAIQAFLVFIVMNLKRMVKLLLQRERLRGLAAS